MRISLLLLMVLAGAVAAEDKINWYGTWEQAQAEAKRLNRPIFLIAAAPHCRNVSGIW